MTKQIKCYFCEDDFKPNLQKYGIDFYICSNCLHDMTAYNNEFDSGSISIDELEDEDYFGTD